MDRLPEAIVQRIMTFLSFADVVRFSILTSRFHSIWQRFPIFEVEFDHKLHHDAGLFLRLLYNHLQSRSTNSLERFSISCNFSNIFNPLGPDLLLLAISHNLRELELKNTDIEMRDNHKDGRYYSIVLPGSIFHLKTLVVLKLDCFRFETESIVLDHRSALKKVRLERTLGIHTISLKENRSLESLEIECCEDMQLVDIDAPCLQHFDFVGSFSMNKCQVSISPYTKALRSLRLNDATVSKSLFLETTPTSQVVENLFFKMSKTMELKEIQLDWPNLKKVEFMGMLHLEKIDLSSEKLESAVLDMAWSPACEVKFLKKCGRFIRSLAILYSEKITGIWLEENLGLFPLLEDFRVEGCSKLKVVEFSHDRIKKLKFLHCNHIDKIEINTPALESLEISLNDKVPSRTMILSQPLHVELSLFYYTSKPVPRENLNRFLMTFKNCKELTLHVNSNFDKLFPTSLRVDPTSLSPLFDVKNLKIDCRFDDDPRVDMVATFGKILKCLFWLIPLPECITFISPARDECIKFEYNDVSDGRVHSCCVLYTKQCWKHRLVGVELSKFDKKNPKSVAKKTELLNFLRENAPRLEVIRDDSEEQPSRDADAGLINMFAMLTP